MIYVLTIGFLFLIGAVTGWIIELFFRRFFTGRKTWINPGFLSGPYLPLYGVSTIALYFLSMLEVPYIWKLLLFLVVPTIIELITGLIFIEHYGIKLWDYSDQRLNYKGIICPLFTVFWGILGILFNILLYPLLFERLAYILNHLELSFFIGLFYGVFAVDLVKSLDVAHQIRKLLSETEERFQVNYERLKLEVRSWTKEHTAKTLHMRFLSPFGGRGRIGLRESIEQEMQKLREGQRSPKGLLNLKKIIRKDS